MGEKYGQSRNKRKSLNYFWTEHDVEEMKMMRSTDRPTDKPTSQPTKRKKTEIPNQKKQKKKTK